MGRNTKSLCVEKKMAKLYCLFFVVLYLLQTADCRINFTSKYNGNTVTGLLGFSMNFTWGFTDVKSIDWGIKQANALTVKLVSIDQSGKVTFPSSPGSAYDGRVNGIRTGDTSGQVTFTLSDIKGTDAKLYGCVISPFDLISEASVIDAVNLRVEELPRIVHPNVSQITYNEGGRVSISCEATGKPDLYVRWIHNGQVRNPGFGMAQISFRPIRRADAGIYMCRANDSVGTKEKRLTVVVNYKPSGVTISTNTTQNTVIQGESVTLTCHVGETKPPVTEYKFYRNGSSLTPATNVNNLVIRDVRRSQHFGEYKCEARNNAGSGPSDAVILNINVPAEIQSLTGNLTVNEGSAIELRCDVTGYPSPTITWRKDGQPKNPGSSLFRIPSSTRSDSGAYVCTADNGVRNKTEKETFVTVIYKPTIKTAVTSAAKSWIGQIVQLHCEADGRPTPTITWKKQDGSKVKEVTAARNNASEEMKTEGDFGTYTCEAENIVGPAVAQTVEIKQIKAPGSPIITSTAADIQATSLTVKWNAPTTKGGSPITAYRVVILRGGDVVRNENFTDLAKEKLIGSLNISTNYTVRVYARNFVFEGIAGEKMIRTKFEGVPAAAEILSLPKETKNTKITLRWSEPANNGKPIKNYTVYQRTIKEDGTPRAWNRISVITDLSDLQVTVQLEKGKIYEFVVAATNEFGESLKEEKKIKKITVVGGVPSAVKLKVEPKGDKVILTWEKPDGNGAAVTNYSVYHRVANANEWEKLVEIPAGSPLRYVFEGEKGKEYEFVVTASNQYGESPKADIESFKVSADESTPPGPPAGRIGTAVIAGAGAAGALLILGLILLIVWWKRRKASSDHGSSVADLHGPNPDDFDDGYHTVGATSAARQLQASGPPGDVTYAEVDKTQKKDKRPVTDVYAEVDKSKKTKKKPKKQPGELDYAELDDLRPNFRPAPQPSGATAKPLVRAPAYEGTEYADITQFGIPQPEPTYGNVPKKDVVYSNVESM